MKRGLATLVLLLMGITRPAAAAESFKVIVNAKVAGKAIRRDSLAEIFLGRADRWADGQPVAPVDLSTTSPVRESFSKAVLEMTVLSVRVYWTRTISAGHFPPPTRTRDEEVVAFVAAHPGGIGYVSEPAALPETVRIVTLR